MAYFRKTNTGNKTDVTCSSYCYFIHKYTYPTPPNYLLQFILYLLFIVFLIKYFKFRISVLLKKIISR